MAKWYLTEHVDMDLDYVEWYIDTLKEGESPSFNSLEEMKEANCINETTTQEEWEKDFKGKIFRINYDEMEKQYLVIRVGRKGKITHPDTKGTILAPYCDYEEINRYRIKPPKGYFARHRRRYV